MVRSHSGLSLLHLMQQAQSVKGSAGELSLRHTPREQELYSYNRSVLTAPAGGASAFADIATAGRAHLGAADEAQWRVRGAPLVRLQQFGRTLRPGASPVVRQAGGLLRCGAAGCRRAGRLRTADGLFRARGRLGLPLARGGLC